MAGKPQAFKVAGASLFLAIGDDRDSYLSLPSAEDGMVLYFRPTKVEKKELSAADKKAMMEAQAAKMRALAAANDPYPGLPSMDAFGRNKKHKQYGKGDASIENEVKEIKKQKKAAAAGGGSEPEPEPAEPTAEEGVPPETSEFDWTNLVEMTFSLMGMSVSVAAPQEDLNPLLAGFDPAEVKYTHHAPEPDSSDSDSSDSDSESEEEKDRGPQVRLARASSV